MDEENATELEKGGRALGARRKHKTVLGVRRQ